MLNINRSKTVLEFIDTLILDTTLIGLNYRINNQINNIGYNDSFSTLKFAINNGIKNIDFSESYENLNNLILNFHNIFLNLRT